MYIYGRGKYKMSRCIWNCM